MRISRNFKTIAKTSEVNTLKNVYNYKYSMVDDMACRMSHK